MTRSGTRGSKCYLYVYINIYIHTTYYIRDIIIFINHGISSNSETSHLSNLAFFNSSTTNNHIIHHPSSIGEDDDGERGVRRDDQTDLISWSIVRLSNIWSLIWALWTSQTPMYHQVQCTQSERGVWTRYKYCYLWKLTISYCVCASVAVSVCVCVCVLWEDRRGMPYAPVFQTSLRGRVAHVISIINSPEGRRQGGEGRGALGWSNRPPCLSQRGILHDKRGGQTLK